MNHNIFVTKGLESVSRGTLRRDNLGLFIHGMVYPGTTHVGDLFA